METLQKTLSQIRELRHEELDLVGGLYTTWTEGLMFTQCVVPGHGAAGPVTDDAIAFSSPDDWA